MSPAEAQMLLGIAASFDNRKPNEEAAIAWSHALNGLRFVDCRDAVVQHYSTSSEWIMPAQIRAHVKRIRAKRIDDHPPLTPPPDLSPVETIAWQQEARRRIGDGEVIDCDAAYGELKARNLAELRVLMPKPEMGEAS